MFRNLDTGMTRDKYFTMMEQLEQEPKDSEIPPDWEDLPDIMVYAMNTFNSLGDRVYPDIGYIGKDSMDGLTYFICFCKSVSFTRYDTSSNFARRTKEGRNEQTIE